MKRVNAPVEVLIGATALVSFIAGCYSETPYLSHPVEMALCFVPVIFTGLSAIVYRTQEKHNKQLDEQYYQDLFGKKITRKGDNCYYLEPMKLHEAIEKLGYIEHDLKGDIYGEKTNGKVS